MKTSAFLLVLLTLAGQPLRASAHELDDHVGDGLAAQSRGSDNELVARETVQGTVAELKAALYDVRRWPDLFSDVRSCVQNPDGSWSIDFQRFGHAHDFTVQRAPGGVVLQLAHDDHGTGRLEFLLEPVDADHSRLSLRFLVSTPPGFTSEQMLEALHHKAVTDLQDFSVQALVYAQEKAR